MEKLRQREVPAYDTDAWDTVLDNTQSPSTLIWGSEDRSHQLHVCPKLCPSLCAWVLSSVAMVTKQNVPHLSNSYKKKRSSPTGNSPCKATSFILFAPGKNFSLFSGVGSPPGHTGACRIRSFVGMRGLCIRVWVGGGGLPVHTRLSGSLEGQREGGWRKASH